MNTADEEETDDDDIYKPPKIIRVWGEELIVGLKRDIILSIIKGTPLFKLLRYFPPILELKHEYSGWQRWVWNKR
jgi:hypothetical protein